MGYTHYIRTDKVQSKKNWEAFTLECTKLIKRSNIDIVGGNGYGEPTIDSQMVSLNGRGDDGHETFQISKGSNHDYCKTARKPYDLVVFACILAAYRNIGLVFGSDGFNETNNVVDCDDLIPAMEYYNDIVQPAVKYTEQELVTIYKKYYDKI
jgi:hypothetical protein